MFRRSCAVVAPACTFSLSTIFVAFACVVGFAQDTAQSSGQKATEGFKPKAVVQTPADEGTLIAKASYFIGFNVVSNAGERANVTQLYDGMKSVESGEDRTSWIDGYNMMKSLKRERPNVDLAKVYEGMKAAAEGPDQTSFVIGHQMMTDFKKRGADFELEKIFEGMKAAAAGKELGMSDEEKNAMLTAFGKLVQKKQVEKLKKEAADNLAAGEAYMAKNASNPNVKKLESGVQYEVLVAGTGAKPTAEDLVKIDYHGTFIDGSVFDSSVTPPNGSPGAPIELVCGQFVPGFSKSLQAMTVGSKWRIVIPGNLGYGLQGSGKIGPNQTLIFEVSLIGITPKK